jgi:hypothetical protein
MESPFEEIPPNKYVYAATLEDAHKLHIQRIEDIKIQEKRDRDEMNAALCRLLNL